MFLSIIITIWNDEKYLAECLDSCLTQNVPYDDYEVVCVDDGSTDRTPEILKDYAQRYSNVVIVNKEHGVGFGRNIGIEHSKGEYIWIIDHDDLIEENSLSLIKEIIEKSECERLYFNYYEFTGELSEAERRLKKEHKLRANGEDKVNNVVWTSVFSRAFLESNDIWPHSKRFGTRKVGYGVDSYFISECREYGVKEYQFTDYPLYYYRKHPGQSVYNFSDANCLNRIECYMGFPLTFRDEYEQYVKENGKADFKTAQRLVMHTRGCVIKLQGLPRKYTKLGIRKMREEGLFPLKLPKVYTEEYSWWDCVKSSNGKGPLKSLAFYYSVNPIGAFFYGILNIRGWLDKLKSTSKLFRKMLLKVVEIKNKLRGR